MSEDPMTTPQTTETPLPEEIARTLCEVVKTSVVMADSLPQFRQRSEERQAAAVDAHEAAIRKHLPAPGAVDEVRAKALEEAARLVESTPFINRHTYAQRIRALASTLPAAAPRGYDSETTCAACGSSVRATVCASCNRLLSPQAAAPAQETRERAPFEPTEPIRISPEESRRISEEGRALRRELKPALDAMRPDLIRAPTPAPAPEPGRAEGTDCPECHGASTPHGSGFVCNDCATYFEPPPSRGERSTDGGAP